MRDVGNFFALLEIGCSDKYYAMTTTQLSCDELIEKYDFLNEILFTIRLRRTNSS